MSPFIQSLTKENPVIAARIIDEEIAFFENEGLYQVAETLQKDKALLLANLEVL